LAGRPAPWLSRDHELLCRAVREAGKIAASFFRKRLAGWDKRPGEPVSEADLAVDDYLRRALLAERPGYGWLSEESEESANRLTAERLWVVDPIDGTRGFLKGWPEYAVAVALIAEGRPVAAVVFNPATDEFFEAVIGGGARLNGAPLAIGERTELAGMKLLVSRRERQRIVEGSGLSGCVVEAISSVAYKIALVAAARADAVVSLSEKSDWDLAAAHLVLAESGGRMTGADGGELRYNAPRPRHDSLVAANPTLHRLLLERLGRR
jgi:myo-inositol-1(or 4)-monophosphatase